MALSADDPITPAPNGRRLFERANEPKRLTLPLKNVSQG
jgi:hypothetical protein